MGSSLVSWQIAPGKRASRRLVFRSDKGHCRLLFLPHLEDSGRAQFPRMRINCVAHPRIGRYAASCESRRSRVLKTRGWRILRVADSLGAISEARLGGRFTRAPFEDQGPNHSLKWDQVEKDLSRHEPLEFIVRRVRRRPGIASVTPFQELQFGTELPCRVRTGKMLPRSTQWSIWAR